MNASRFNQLISSLTNVEHKWFLRYLRSTYFNRNEVVAATAALLETDQRLPDGQTLHKLLFPNEPFVAQQVYDVTSFLFRHLEDFLALRQAEAANERLSLLQALRKRRQPAHFTKKLKTFRSQLNKETIRNEAWHYQSFQLESEADFFLLQQETRSTDDCLQTATDALDCYYISAKLRMTCEMLSRINVVQTSYDIVLAQELVAHIQAHWQRYESTVSVVMYFQVYQMLSHPDEEAHYFEVIDLLERHTEQFPTAEARELYNYARNYCIRKINRGKSEFLNELFALYQRITENGLIYDGQFMTQWDYKNAITAALRIDQYDWVESFIENQRERIDPRFRENAYNYNRSNFLYEKGEVRQALRLLQTVDFTDVYYGLSARSLLLKIYYEQEDEESLITLFSAFRTYLKRNKLVSSYQREVHENLVLFTRKALRLRMARPNRITPAFKQQVAALREEIETAGQITNAKWLLGQVDLLLHDGA